MLVVILMFVSRGQYLVQLNRLYSKEKKRLYLKPTTLCREKNNTFLDYVTNVSKRKQWKATNVFRIKEEEKKPFAAIYIFS